MRPGEFVVLFHLCDCHNPSLGCFPSQEYLMDRANVSNGSLNNHLNALEARGLIRRVRAIDDRTKRQRPTRYILGFEIGEAQGPSTGNGDGNPPDLTPEDGGGAVSKKQADPSPKNGPTRLQKLETNLVKGTRKGTTPLSPPTGGRRRNSHSFGVSEAVKRRLLPEDYPDEV
ncbi:hypothetical protein BV394_02075 [Brevirhabdus pacifica]|uniref:Helix-turn-helix protein n=1 Tax=Brevirhabdus pacifica TaxID=1267768 RepID=A0A1U7DF93_9RHOB|nr:hypothetical protein BV394_02075 [Brevirhabdus pacifica]